LTDVYNAYQTVKETHTSYTYDEAGNKLTQTDANNHTTTWTYDALGRVATRTLPEGQQESFSYDDNGNQQSHTDFNGHTTTFGYDTTNRLTQVSYYDGSSESYTYTLTGQRDTATDARGTTTYTYDVRDRLKTETQPDGTVLSYDYDEAGNRNLLQTAIANASTGTTDTTVTEYSFDNLNRLYSVTDAHNQTTTYGYDEVGNRQTVTYPNGTVTTYSYDTLNRLTDIITRDNTNTVIDSFHYDLYPTGHRHVITEANGCTSDYVYDELYRLKQETITDPTLGTIVNSYDYDNVGNRSYSTENGVSTAYAYDMNDRLLSAGGEYYTYDDNGSLLTTTIDNRVTTNSYDARNKLVDVTIANSGTTASHVMYHYDIDGARTQKNDNNTVTNFVVDKNRDYAQVIHETNDQNATQVTYHYGDDLISQDRANTINYYNYDGLGSTRSLTDSTGHITDTYLYSAYGETLDHTGNTENNYQFTGEQYDAAQGNYYLRNRYYDPNAGSFTQMDSYDGRINDPITLHKYLYTNGDPVNNVDPSGKFSMINVMKAVNIVGILATTTAVSVRFSTFIPPIEAITASGKWEPDSDHKINIHEATYWWRNGNGVSQTVPLSSIDLSMVSASEFGGVGKTLSVNLDFRLGTNPSDASVYGGLTLRLVNQDRVIVEGGKDRFDFDEHKRQGSVWNQTLTVLRNLATGFAALSIGRGTPFDIYITGDAKISR